MSFSVRRIVEWYNTFLQKRPFYSNNSNCKAIKIRNLKKRTEVWQKKPERKTTVGMLENFATVRTVHSETKTFRTGKHALSFRRVEFWTTI